MSGRILHGSKDSTYQFWGESSPQSMSSYMIYLQYLKTCYGSLIKIFYYTSIIIFGR